MPTLAEVRKQYPELDGLDDQAAVDVLHGTFYPDMSREKVADALGVKPEAPKPAESSRMLDLAKSLKVGIEELPGLATGLADIVPALVYGGRPFTDAADWMGRATGFTPGKWAKETKFSPAYEESAKQIDEAWKPSEAVSADPNASAMDYARALWESAPDLALEYVKHPLYTLNQAAQSLPSMVAGGVLSRGLMTAGRVAEVAARPAAAGAAAVAARKAVPGYLERAVGEKWAPAIAGGVGEGSQQAGQQMDQGSALPDQRANAIAALSSGAIDAVISAGAGRLANRMGLETAETAMAKLGDKATVEGKPMSRLKRVAGGAVSEGVLQETPQSAQEQMWKNYAEGKPLFEGVARQAIEGGLAGAVMGAGANVMTGHESPPDPRALKLPENGPMSRALNRGLDAEAQQQAAGITPVGGEQPEAPLPPIKMTKAQESSLLAFANHRAAELESKRDGTKESTDEKGNVTPAIEPQFLTPEEEKELAFLKANGGDSQALAHVYQPKKVQKAAKAQRDADKPEPPTGEQQPGDIVAASTGKPFKNIMTATSALDRAGEGHEIIAVKDGLVVRKKAEAPAPSSVGLAKAFDDLKGGGVTDNLYDQLFQALQDGKDTVAGVKDPVLAKAKPAFDAGLIKSPADLRAHVAAGFPASAAPGAQSAAEKPQGESNGQEGASEQGRGQGRRRQEGLLTEEQAGAKAAPATPKRVKVNDRHVELNTDQAAEWDRVAAEYKSKFDDAKATFEREKTQATPDNHDVGLRSAQDRYDAKRKALGYQLAAERRRIAGLPTPKERAAEEKKAAALRTGDAVTFQNEDGTQAAGTITGMAYGKFRVKAEDGSTRTMTRDALTKTERSVETATTVTEKAKSKDATTAAAPAEPATQASRAETPAPATAAEPASDAGAGTGKVEAAGVKNGAILETINGDDGMRAVISQGEKGLHVTLRDGDSNNSVATIIGKPEHDIAWAREKAAELLGQKKVAAPVTSAARWATFSPVEREKALIRAGWGRGSKSTTAMLSTAWDKMTPSQQSRLTVAIEPTAEHTAATESKAKEAHKNTEQLAVNDVVYAKNGGAKGVLRRFMDGKNVMVWWDGASGPTAYPRSELTKEAPAAPKPEITNTRGGSSAGHELQTAMSSAGWSAEDKGSSNTHWQKHSGKDRYTAILTPARDGNAPRIEVTALDAGGIEVQVSAFDVESAEQAAKSADAAIAKDQHGTDSAKATPKPGANTIFTEDAAAKARELLRKKLGQVSSGIDPEIMQAGITLAGYHIEKGARTFAAYAKAMLADLGSAIRPYLKSFYNALRDYPGFDPSGMDSYDSVASSSLEVVLGEAGDSSVGKSAPNGVSVMSRLFGDGPERKAIVEHGFNGLGVKDQQRVLAQVRGAIHDPQIRRSVVEAIPADVMSMLVGRKVTSDDLSRDESMLTGALSIPGDASVPVPVVRVIDALSSSVKLEGAGARTERQATGGNVGGSTVSGASAADAGDRGHGGHGTQSAPRSEALRTEELKAENAGIDPQTSKTANAEDTSSAVNQTETSDERGLQSQGAQALGEVAAGEGGRTEGVGTTGRGAATGGEPVQGTGGRTDGSGVSAPRGGRSGAAGVHPAQAGGKGKSRTVGEGGTRRKGKGVPQADVVAKDDTSQATGAAATPTIPAANFVITPDLRLGEGAEAEKFSDNLAAILALKTIEAENRRATPEEQRILARYVGWGGMPNAFPSPITKLFKPEWKDRGEALRDALTPQEYRRASNSTTDAHYTSETVTKAIWDAVKRLGFRGGLTLEMSVGSGNFIGLMPQDVAGHTRMIGVELDSITARIARALYPQSTIIESGMQYVPLADGAFDLDIGNPPFGSTSLTWQYKPELRGLSIHNQFFIAGLDALKPGGIQAKVVSRYLMDAQDSAARVALAKKGKLLGAIRLPETAFKTNARTEVVTDIIFIQRLTPAEEEQMNAIFDAANGRPEKNPVQERERRALAAQVPDWVQTVQVRDPLGGEPMTVNQYFRDNQGMIVGTLDRSGSMHHGADITVKLAKGADFAAELRRRIESLPEGVLDRSDDAIKQSVERYRSMADALEIAVSGQEPGQMVLTNDGKLMQVMERETPEGGYEMTKREVTADAPWSPQLFMNDKGQWYRNIVNLGEDGKPLKQTKEDGTASTRNVYEREVFGDASNVPSTLKLGKTRLERLRDIAGLRDLLKKQLVLEAQDDSTEKMEANRRALAAAYDAYVAKHGFVSEAATSSLVNSMPDGALVQALELSFKPAITAAKAAKTGDKPREASAKRAPIMDRRVVEPYAPPGTADTASDALQISLSERGIIDIERVAALRGLTTEQATEELTGGDRPLAFHDPELSRLETRDAYLTGEVARKLKAAKAAGLARNVEALEAVQPEPITSDNVTAIMGSTWIPSETYADFVAHITGAPATVSFEPVTNTRSVIGQNTTKSEEWASRDESGRIRVPATTLLQDAMNSQATRVTYVDSEGVTHLDKAATELAAIQRQAIEREFAEWVFADGDRRRMLVAKFNEKFNTRVTRQHDGSHLTLPGKVPDEIIDMRRHQKNAIWRGIAERFMLVDHVVGAGKTFTAIARVMERRRMGLSNKPMIVVPNHLVEEWAVNVYKLYPGAKVLAAGNKDFEARARRRLFGKIATGDWDVVIVPHSSFAFIGLAPETEDAFLQEELRQALQAVKEAEREAAQNDTGGRPFKPLGVKKAEQLVKKIEARIDAIRSKSRKDRLLTFEQMGIDDMTIDEAHEFKNLFYSSRMTSVRGMGDPTGSMKAFDLYTKIRYLRSTPTGSVVFMTGTPISNSAVEMYTMMRYLAADELRDLGLEHFDAWRTQFVDASTGYEQQLTGGVKEVGRLGRTWGNARSLMDLYYSFTDAVTLDDIKAAFAEDNPGREFPTPKVKGGDRQQIVVKPSAAQSSLLEEIFDAYDNLPNIANVKERNAKRLRLMDQARKVSLDIRAADPNVASKEEGGKLDRVSDEIARIYKKWTPDLGTQLVFLDRSVPKSKNDAAEIKAYDKAVAVRDKAIAEGDEDKYRESNEAIEAFDANAIEEMRRAQAGGWSAYQQIKDNLIARGIPAREIRFVQEANNDEQKQALFDAVNAGEVRVLIGSTPRMGAGTNVQERLVGLHHVDVGWKPSDIEQREGRIVRQGNSLLDKYGRDFEVEILSYATERTADAAMWALNSTKLKTINGIRKYDGSFTMDFEDEDSLSMAQMAALASGDPMLLERIQLVGEIDKLERQETAHRRKLIGLQDRIESAEQGIADTPAIVERNQRQAEVMKAWEDRVKDAAAGRSAVVEGKTYSGPGAHFDAARAAADVIKEQQAGDENAKFTVAIGDKRLTSKTGVESALHEAFGDSSPFEATIFGKTETTRAGAVRRIVERARELSINLGQGQSEGFDIGESMGLKLVGDVSRDDWKGRYDISFSLMGADGRTLASVQSTDKSEKHDFSTQFVRATFDKLMGSKWSDGYLSSASYYQTRLNTYEKELPELRRQLEATGPFKRAGELGDKRARLEEVTRILSGGAPAAVEDATSNLAQARAEHQAVLNRLATGATATVEDIRNVGSLAANDTDVVFSRGAPAGSSVAPDDLRAQVDEWTKGWKNAPEGGVHVVDSAMQLPRLTRRMDPTARAWFDPKTKAVYLVADRLGSMSEAQFALFHEVYGHYGLRSFLGDDYDDTMMRLRGANDGLSMQAAVWFSRYGQDEIRRRVRAGMSIEKATRYVRLLSTEEALADRAASNEPVSGLKQLMARVQRALRAIGLNAVADWMENHTDAEVLDLLLQARREVQRGGRAHAFMGADTLFGKDASLADDAQRQIDYLEDRAREAGFSGLDDMVMRDPEAFEKAAEQWRAENPAEVLYSRASTLDALRSGDWRQQASDALNDALRTSTTFNGWWHRTVGTQYHKAQVDSDFARVYHAGQDYLHDTSAFANDAAAFAPDLLPRLESLGDLKRLAYRQADRDALAAPIFQGTLEGTRLTQDELRSRFKLTDKQIGLYNEFRASVDRSLDTLVASDVARYLAVGNDLPRALKDMISDGDVARFKGLVNALLKEKVDSTDQVLSAVRREQRKEMSAFYAEQRKAFEAVKPGGRLAIEQRWEDRKNELQRQHEKALKRAQAEHDKWVKAKRTIDDKYEKVENLKAQGYAPLMRFGRYTVTQRDTEGNVTYFSMFESEREANQMARELAGDAGHTVERGVMSQEAFKQFRGMTPETMGLFADLAGIEHSDAFQQYLHLAVANRSALKRLIKRKGTAGFSEDVSRVLASFITSNARGASGNLHLGEMSRAVAAIPKAKGDVIDEAVKLRDYLTNPQEEAHQLRGLLFINFIGGSVAAAMSNMTQPITTTLPYLSQFSGPLSAARRVAAAMVTAVTGTTDKELRAALEKAAKEDITNPQEIHQLHAESIRGFGNKRGVRAALHVWGSLFALAEQWNRRVSFIAAWETAKANKLADPFAFASDATDATQFVYNKGNRPNWARGALGATLFTFKQFSISYLEMLKRLPTRERALALAILMLAAGAQGLPFADDLDDMIDSIAQGLGYDFNSKGAKHKFLAQHLGDGGADFVLRGLSAIPGVPLDVAGRMSLGNLIPASGVFLKSKQDKGQEIAEALGSAGGLAQGVGKAMQGDLKGMAPAAIQNLIRAIDMYQTGMYRDSKGRKVLATDNVDAAIKAIGFQPAQIAREQRKISVGMQQIALAKAVQSEIVSTWAQGIFEKDKDKVSEAQKKLREWNENNPESRIVVSRQAIVSQVRAMNMTREERFIKAAPKTMRPTVLAGGGA